MTTSLWLNAAHLGLSPFPTAKRFFTHFLHGQGRPAWVNTHRLLAEDQGLQRFVAMRVLEATRQGQTEGHIKAPQPVLTNWNWRLALGTLELHWKQIHSDIELRFEKSYRWTPQTWRLSRPIHRAAALACKGSARCFPIVGEPARVSIQSMETCAPPGKHASLTSCICSIYRLALTVTDRSATDPYLPYNRTTTGRDRRARHRTNAHIWDLKLLP